MKTRQPVTRKARALAGIAKACTPAAIPEFRPLLAPGLFTSYIPSSWDANMILQHAPRLAHLAIPSLQEELDYKREEVKDRQKQLDAAEERAGDAVAEIESDMGREKEEHARELAVIADAVRVLSAAWSNMPSTQENADAIAKGWRAIDHAGEIEKAWAILEDL